MTEGGKAKDRRQYLYPNIRTYYSEPLVLARGRGITAWDTQGREYLDLFGGILTVSLGHAHAAVTEAVIDQVQKISHTSTCYLNEPMLDVAEHLARITPGRLERCFFTNSGTEANETAIMTARAYTGNHHVIALRHSYHGRSSLATSITGNAAWRPVGSEHPGVTYAHNGYCYRCPFHLSYPSCDVACARDIENLIQTTTSGRVAALIAEPVQGVGGFITPPPEYFRIASDIVRRHGGIFICDEVQTGFGRTGGRMFGIEHWDVEPEIMVFAKGLANGAPVGATIALPEVAEAFEVQSISTFGGNPVSMAAAMATLREIEEQDMPAHVARIGDIFHRNLIDLSDRFTFIGDVRGMGLMIGLELVGPGGEPVPDLASRFLEEAREEGILVGRGGLFGNVIRLTPPMTISDQEAEQAVDGLERVCQRLQA